MRTSPETGCCAFHAKTEGGGAAPTSAGIIKVTLTLVLVDRTGLETREQIEREAEETHGTEGQVVGNLTRLLVCHLACVV